MTNFRLVQNFLGEFNDYKALLAAVTALAYRSVHRVNMSRRLLSWFAVMTKPRCEAQAQICLARQGFECLFPRVRRSVRAASGMIVRTESLFPRYVFIRSDPSLQSLSPVRSTRGVTGIVRFGFEPACVPDEVVEQIRARIDAEDGFVKLAVPDLVCGAAVRINEGPFSGLDAIFMSHQGEDRVRLLLTMLNSEREIVIPKSVLGARI